MQSSATVVRMRSRRSPQGDVDYHGDADFILDGVRKIGIEITNFFLEHGLLSHVFSLVHLLDFCACHQGRHEFAT